MTDDVQEELEMEPGMHGPCRDPMTKVLTIVADSLSVLLDWKLSADGSIAL